MATIEKVALVGAVAVTCVAVGDAVVLAATGNNLVTDDSDRWLSTSAELIHAVGMLALAAALVVCAQRVDAGRRWRRRVRRGLALSLAVLGGFFAVLPVGELPSWAEAVGGTAFLLSFVLGVVLGVGLLRDPSRRLAGALLASPLLVLPLMGVVEQIAPRWSHPGWAEAGLYLGTALLVQPVPWTRDRESREPVDRSWTVS